MCRKMGPGFPYWRQSGAEADYDGSPLNVKRGTVTIVLIVPRTVSPSMKIHIYFFSRKPSTLHANHSCAL